MYDGTAEWRFIYDAGGSIVGFMNGSSTYYYKKNLQGDVIAIFDNNFNEVVTYEYDSWGNLMSQGGAKAAAYVKLGRDNPIRYRGYFYDTDTGLYYLQSRYYNAQWGRFVNEDGLLTSSLDLNSMHNLFAYCSNNPIMNIDPTGLCPCAWEAYCTCPDCDYYLKKIGKPKTYRREELSRANSILKRSPSELSSLDKNSYNCYGNGIGKQINTSPTGYIRGDSTRTTFEYVVNDLGAENVRELNSIDDVVYAGEFKVAMKCGPVDFHFIRQLDDGTWYNKSGTATGIVVDRSDVTSDIWYPIHPDANGNKIVEPWPAYPYETIYFAVKVR